MSGKLENLRRLLRQGYTPAELVAQGYPKTSVYKAAAQLGRRCSPRVSHTAEYAGGVLAYDRPYVLEVAPSKAQLTTELESKTDELIWLTKQTKKECEMSRIEGEEARKTATAERQVQREQEKISRARRLRADALQAHRAGKINNFQLIALTSGRETMDDIESGENCLRSLVADASIRR